MWKPRRTKAVPVERVLSFEAGPDDATFERARQGDAAAWTDLWTLLCHQGTVHRYSGRALPVLADIAPTVADLECWWEPVQLAAKIIAATDHPFDPDRADLRGPYAEAIGALRRIALHDLERPVDDTMFAHQLQALAAFDDVPVLQHDLECVADGELELACPHCGAPLALDLGEVPLDDPRRVEARPADPEQLEDRARALHAECLRRGRHGVAAAILTLLGTLTCVSCGRELTVADAST